MTLVAAAAAGPPREGRVWGPRRWAVAWPLASGRCVCVCGGGGIYPN